jgi:hypothetical protein
LETFHGKLNLNLKESKKSGKMKEETFIRYSRQKKKMWLHRGWKNTVWFHGAHQCDCRLEPTAGLQEEVLAAEEQKHILDCEQG